MSNTVPKSKRRPSNFDCVDIAGDIYDRVLSICLRMPKRYTYLVLQDILHLAGEVLDYAVKGDSIRLNIYNENNVGNDIRTGHFLNSRASLKSLIRRMSFFSYNPNALRQVINGKEIGVTSFELDELSDLMNTEMRILNGVLESDKKRIRDAKTKRKQESWVID